MIRIRKHLDRFDEITQAEKDDPNIAAVATHFKDTKRAVESLVTCCDDVINGLQLVVENHPARLPKTLAAKAQQLLSLYREVSTSSMQEAAICATNENAELVYHYSHALKLNAGDLYIAVNDLHGHVKSTMDEIYLER